MALSSGLYLDPLILTEQQLLDIYNAAVANLKTGKILTDWQGEGTSAGHTLSAPTLDILREARNALKQKNPLRYGWIATRSKVIFA
jgi:hypothetical protein